MYKDALKQSTTIKKVNSMSETNKKSNKNKKEKPNKNGWSKFLVLLKVKNNFKSIL